MNVSAVVQVRAQVPELCVLFHESVQALSRHFLAKERRHVYITPTSYLELIHSYKNLLSRKQNEVLCLALLLKLAVHASSAIALFCMCSVLIHAHHTYLGPIDALHNKLCC